MKGEDIKKNSDLIDKYSKNIVVKLLIYLGKLKSASQFEDYLKQLNKILADWFFETFIVRAFLIFICLLVAGATLSYTTPIIEKFIAAEGISIVWFLIIELKKDLFEVKKNG